MILGLIAALAAAPWDSPMTYQGIGSLRIGMPVAALRRMGATGEDYPDPDVDCSYWHTPRWPGLNMMVSGGRVVRIETEDRRYRTASGVRVGMTEAEIRRIYGPAMRVEPHPYTGPQGHYLILRARGAPYGLIVETDPDTGRATQFRVGLWQAVQLIEGCS
jgi:hypothetical protein